MTSAKSVRPRPPARPDQPDTFPPGALVRLRTHPTDGPHVVVAVVTREWWGGAFTTAYRLSRGLLGMSPLSQTFEADAANVYAYEADELAGLRVTPADPLADFANPMQGPPCGEGAPEVLPFEPFPADAKAVPPRGRYSDCLKGRRPPETASPAGPLAWERLTSASERSADRRFLLSREPGGMFTACDARTHREAGPMATRHAAELWCLLQRENGRTPAESEMVI